MKIKLWVFICICLIIYQIKCEETEVEYKCNFEKRIKFKDFQNLDSNHNGIDRFYEMLGQSIDFCTIRKLEEVNESFDYFFSSYVLFQPLATKLLKSMILRKLTNPSTPMTLLIAGDHGLGKTTSANLISRVMFNNGYQFVGDGEIMVNGEDIKLINSNSDEIEKARMELRSNICRRLVRCPSSIVVIDEIQKAHPQVLSILEPFMDGQMVQCENQIVNSGLSMFVLVSDFEKEGLTVDKSPLEITTLVSQFTKLVYRDYLPKLPQLISQIIPFLSDSSNAEQYFSHRFKTLHCEYPTLQFTINNSRSVLNHLIEYKNKIHTHDNFRGLSSTFDKEVTGFINNKYFKSNINYLYSNHYSHLPLINQINYFISNDRSFHSIITNKSNKFKELIIISPPLPGKYNLHIVSENDQYLLNVK